MDHNVLETSTEHYVLVEPLAEGGMGTIFLGKRLTPNGKEEQVVLKQLLPEHTRDPNLIELFLREAELTASLNHPAIVRMFDLVTTGDEYYMVMEYIRGGDLQNLLKRTRRHGKRLSLESTIFIARQVLSALIYAHARTGDDGRVLGMVHRDVSPSNILIAESGLVKLTDFGIAKVPDHQSVMFKVKGKVGYMAPEQARAGVVDPRSDLFSFGVVLYEMLVGEKLFVGDMLSSPSMIYSQPIVAPSSRRPEVPPALDQIVLKALALEPSDRFQNGLELDDALHQVAEESKLLGNAIKLAIELKKLPGSAYPLTRLDEGTLNEHTSQTSELDLREAASFDGSPRTHRLAQSPPKGERSERIELTSVIKARGRSGSESLPIVVREREQTEPVTSISGSQSSQGEIESGTSEFLARAESRPATSPPSTSPPSSSVDLSDLGAEEAPSPVPVSEERGIAISIWQAPWVQLPVAVVLVVLLLGIGVIIGFYFSGPELAIVQPWERQPSGKGSGAVR